MENLVIEDAVGQALGMSARSSRFARLGLADAVDHGLTVAAFDHLVQAMAPNDPGFAYRVIPKATLSRRRRGNDGEAANLTSDESARVMRLACIWALAREAWQDDEDARDFLFRPHPLLEGRKPIDVVLANEFGLPVVQGLLGGLIYGTAA